MADETKETSESVPDATPRGQRARALTVLIDIAEAKHHAVEERARAAATVLEHTA